MKYKIAKKHISKFINEDFRQFALYTLQARGIPAFDDSLTNVQRLILKNAKKQYEKTLSLVGACIADGYDHGDSSLAGAIAKITREFSCADNLLEGKGFWGNSVVHEASAPRYTAVKLNESIAKYFNYSHLDTKTNDTWDCLHLEIPIGLASLTAGIAVGYKSLILPRKLEDIEKFYRGKLTMVKPYLKNFNGTIKKLKDGWLIKGVYEAKGNIIKISDVPPIIKYSVFMKRLINALDKAKLKYKITNDSAKVVNIKIIYEGDKKDELQLLKDIVDKNISLLVKESIVFVKDNEVIKYEKIEDYLNDYKIRRAEIYAKDYKDKLSIETFNLEFAEAKLAFLTFMVAKKRNRDEVKAFIGGYSPRISSKLDALKLTTLNKESIEDTKQEISRLKQLIKELSSKSIALENEYAEMLKNFKYSGKINETVEKSSFQEDEDGLVEGRKYQIVTPNALIDKDEAFEIIEEADF